MRQFPVYYGSNYCPLLGTVLGETSVQVVNPEAWSLLVPAPHAKQEAMWLPHGAQCDGGDLATQRFDRPARDGQAAHVHALSDGGCGTPSSAG